MQHGFVLWFTGLSGSGKSTLTALISAELRRRGVHVETLDGDEVRRRLSKGLGFSREDRDENVRRIGFVAKLVARSGGCAIAAAISPYREVRDEIRKICDRFVEVYTECPVAVLAARDPKGLYKKALAGEIRNFTGVDDPYEAPISPDVHLHTDREPSEESLRRILATLEDRGLVPRSGGTAAHPDDANSEPELVPPHGGELVDGIARGAARDEAAEIARSLPSVTLDPGAQLDLLALAAGAYSPLDGFMTSKDFLRVVREMRLENGLPWSLPVTLPVADAAAVEIRRVGELALALPDGRRVATMHVEDVFRPDRHEEQRLTGATRATERTTYVGGKIRCFDPDAIDVAPGPRDVRDRLAALGFRRVTALDVRHPPLLFHEHLVRAALELSDGVLVRPLRGAADAVPADVRMRAWELVAAAYFRKDRALVVPHSMTAAVDARRAGIHAALTAKNFGACRVVFVDGGEDRGRTDAWISGFTPGELGIELVATAPAVLSERVAAATIHTAPDVATAIDVDAVVRDLVSGRGVDERLVRREVASLLRDVSRASSATG